MLRIFLILSLAVSLAGVAFSFVLKDKVTSLSEQRDTFKSERDKANSEAAQAKSAEKKAREAEKAAKSELESTQQELTSKSSQLNEAEATLTKTAKELEETKVARDLAQRGLAQWTALGVKPDEIQALKAAGQRLLAERDAFAEEKKVLSREISRLTEELDIYRGVSTEVAMPDVRGQVTTVDPAYQFVTLDKGSEDGLKPNGKMIITRDNHLVAKVQLVRVEARTSVANLLPDWKKGDVQPNDKVMTSYEALSK